VIAVHCRSESQLILIETLQQENAKFAECQAIEEVTRTVSRLQMLALCQFDRFVKIRQSFCRGRSQRTEPSTVGKLYDMFLRCVTSDGETASLEACH